jgi:hypothetical protein
MPQCLAGIESVNVVERVAPRAPGLACQTVGAFGATAPHFGFRGVLGVPRHNSGPC